MATTATLALCIIAAVAGAILVILGFAGRGEETGLPARRLLKAREKRRLNRT